MRLRLWVSARIDVDIVGFTTVRVDLSRYSCNLLHMTASSPPTSHAASGTVLHGVPVVGGVQYAPVIRPGRLPVVDVTSEGAIGVADRPAEAARFGAAAT